VVRQFTEKLEDDQGFRYNNFVTEFPNGSRINCMTSNPRRFRSKGGDVCLDEFDWHDSPGEMLDAAMPVTTWGFNISILSTRNAEGSEFDKLIKTARKIQKGELVPGRDNVLPWSLHTTPITVAVEQGLAEKIYKLSSVDPDARSRFLAECRAKSRNEDAFLREYMCTPSSAASTLIPYDVFQSCEDDMCLQPLVHHNEGKRQYFGGVDIGREQDLTEFWIAEMVGDVLVTRLIVPMRKAKYQEQLDMGNKLFSNLNIHRACIDATGLGDTLAEFWQDKWGAHRINKVKFTATIKDHLASLVLGRFTDRRIRVPADPIVRDSFHRVKKTITATGNVRYDAARTDEGHSDDFWACGLCSDAAHAPVFKPGIEWL